MAPVALREIPGFRILREIGHGGMGTVYEALDLKMNRRVALKILSRHHSRSEKAEVRFTREAWIGGKLNHPNLVKVFEMGSWEDLSFYSMELVDGGSLYDVIRSMKRSGRDETQGLQFGSREYIAWAIGQVVATARGLDHAHRQGVIHRDIKPMNLLLTKDPPMVKIADFGLALDPEAIRLTTSGKVFGSVAYMAPEQIQGKRDEIDARTDVYSLGVTLFELIALGLPYQGETQEHYMNAVLTAEPRRPSRLNNRVSRDLDIVVGKALEKDRRDRYESAAAFAEDLENVLGFKPIRARPPTTPARLWKWTRRKPVHAALAALLIIAFPSVGVLSVRAVQHQRLVAKIELDELWGRARRLIQDDQPREALGPLTEMLRRNPGHIEALRGRAMSYWKLAERESEAAHRPDLERLGLDDISRVVDLSPRVSWPYRIRALMLARFGRAQEARSDEETAARVRSDSPTDDDVMVDGILALEASEFTRAATLFSEVLARRPGLADLYLYRAKAYEFVGDRTRALVDYQVAAGLMPSDFNPRYNLGRLMVEMGDLENAGTQYRRALEIDPNSAHTNVGLADVLLRQGRSKATAGDVKGARRDFKEAAQEARRGVDLDPSSTWAHLNLGFSLREENSLREKSDPNLLNEAFGHFEQVISLWRARGGGAQDDDYAQALENMCDALIELRDLERALTECRRTAEIHSDQRDSFYNLAGVYALLGRTEEALQALEKDLALGDIDHAYLAADAWFVSLRGDPRFKALLDRMRKAADKK